jgi:surfactin synthase thioesterase subunit
MRGGHTEQGDNRYSKDQLAEWRVHTTGAYDERWFEGNTEADYWGTSHRFLIDDPSKFQEFLAVRLRGVLHISHRVLRLTRSR